MHVKLESYGKWKGEVDYPDGRKAIANYDYNFTVGLDEKNLPHLHVVVRQVDKEDPFDLTAVWQPDTTDTAGSR